MADKKTPEKQEGAEGQPEQPKQKKPEPEPRQLVHQLASQERGEFRKQEGLDRLKQIDDRKKQIDEEQQRLRQEAGSKRSRESWIGQPNKNELIEEKIAATIEKKFDDPDIKSMLEKNGLDEKNNARIIKACITNILNDYLHKLSDTELVSEKFNLTNKISDYANNILLEKIQYLFGELGKAFDAKKHRFGKPIELLEAFSNFTGTNFLKNGVLQPNELKDFLSLERSNYESFVAGFLKSLGLESELTTLKGEETNIMGKKVDVQKLIEEGKVPFKKIKVTIPKNDTETNTMLQAEIPKALPENIDAQTKQKIVDYLAAEIKKQNPKPDEVFELSPDGKWNKINIAVEQENQIAAQQAAQKQAEPAAPQAAPAETPPSGNPFDLKNIINQIMKFFMDIFKYIGAIFGVKTVVSELDSKFTEWRNMTDEEKQEITNFYKEMKNFLPKINNLDPLIKDPDSMRKVLTARKRDTKTGETWNGWILRHLSASEQQELNSNNPPAASRIAEMFISENARGTAEIKTAGNQQENPPQRPTTPPPPGTPVG